MDTPPTTCGGSLISRSTILTAAHCFRTLEEGDVFLEPVFVEVILGEHDIKSISPNKTEQVYNISNANIEVHPLYDQRTLDNDIAKVHLDQPIDFTQHPKIRPICLPASPDEDHSGRDAKATGWGGGMMPKTRKAAEVLQAISMRVISVGECNQRLINHHDGRASRHLATEKEICAIRDTLSQLICLGKYFLIMEVIQFCTLNF